MFPFQLSLTSGVYHQTTPNTPQTNNYGILPGFPNFHEQVAPSPPENN